MAGRQTAPATEVITVYSRAMKCVACERVWPAGSLMGVYERGGRRFDPHCYYKPCRLAVEARRRKVVVNV
jgi:hypothetical protein